MLDWLTRGRKTDHPMHSVEEAKLLLADLPRDPLQALQEATSWLTTFTAASDVRLPLRIAITRLIDEAGQPFAQKISEPLTWPSVKEFTRNQYWKAVLADWRAATDAYTACLEQLEADPKRAGLAPPDLAVLHVRVMRALNEQDKLLHLRYEPVSERGDTAPGLQCILSPGTPTRKPALRSVPVRRSVWEPMLRFYRSSVAMRCDTARVAPYPRERSERTPQQELVSALMLQAASPESLLPRQVDMAARLAARFSSSFLFSARTHEGCNWFVDLELYERNEPAPLDAPSIRYFGAGAAVDKIERLILELSTAPERVQDPLDVSAPAQDQVVILKQLVANWKRPPPLRRETRPKGTAQYEVAHGFQAACDLLKRKAKSHHAIEIPDDTGSVPFERWLSRDVSTWGMGLALPRKTESWIGIGALCTLRQPGEQWSLAVVRRIYRDRLKMQCAGLEILAKKPRVLVVRGGGGAGASIRGRQSASDQRGIFRIIILEDKVDPTRTEILTARQAFFPGVVYDVLWRNNTTRQLRMDEQFEQGDDFDRGTFTWLT